MEITLGRGELPRVGRKDPCASRLTPPQAYLLRRKSHPGRCQHGLCDGSGVSPWVSSVLTLVFRDGAAEKVAGGAGVGHRVGVVDVEDQGKVERVGAGGQGFGQDAVAPDVLEGDAAVVPAEVVGEVAGGDRPGAQGALRVIRTCRLAVSGQVARRYPSQASRASRVSSPRGCRWSAMLMRRLGRSMSSRVSSRMAPGRAARISSAVIGSTVRPAPRPPRRCRVGSANVRPRRQANRNSERSAVMAL